MLQNIALRTGYCPCAEPLQYRCSSRIRIPEGLRSTRPSQSLRHSATSRYIAARSMESDNQQSNEEDESLLASSSEPSSRVFFSAVLTLTLSILGSSVLPIPYAFSRLGVVCGLLTQLIVALCNAVASVLLLNTASAVGHTSYESVAEAVGGRPWKILTQVSLLALLFGTMVGDFALLGDVGNQAISSLTDSPPGWLDKEGRLIMAALAFGILPICCLRRMRSLEVAGTVGLSVILAVMAIIIYQSIAAGLPAIASGELPLWRLKLTSELPEAMSVMGFAFYVTPMLLPLRSEIAAGPQGDRLTRRATVVVVVVVAQLVYGSLGVFGAARHGLQTAGNVLVNHWLPAKSQGTLDIIIALYLGISIPPISLALRCTLDCLIAGEGASYSPLRHYSTTILPLLASLAVALASPQMVNRLARGKLSAASKRLWMGVLNWLAILKQCIYIVASEKIFAITGATAVMLICYLIPVALHLMQRKRILKGPQLDNAAEPLLAEGMEQKPKRGSEAVAEIMKEVVVPILVATIGVGCSVAALVVAVSSAISMSRH